MIANLREDLFRTDCPATLSRMRESQPSRTTNALYQYVRVESETESSVNGFETENVLPPGERGSKCIHTKTHSSSYYFTTYTKCVKLRTRQLVNMLSFYCYLCYMYILLPCNGTHNESYSYSCKKKPDHLTLHMYRASIRIENEKRAHSTSNLRSFERVS